MTDPAEPTPTFCRRVGKLPALTRDRVLERSTILHAQGGRTWRECDELALRMEAPQRGLFE